MIISHLQCVVVFLMVLTHLCFKQVDGLCSGTTQPQVSIKQGVLQGNTISSYKQKPYCAFEGIPYAEPPVKELRFKPPRPLTNWQGVLNATELGNACLQPNIITGELIGSEDCLYLNVYIPEIKDTLENKGLLDVVVNIHSGEFFSGEVNNVFLEPYYFTQQNLVLVTVNYRLGPFGFLSTGDDESPGNYGLKDQVTTLHWVQDNIEAFGGNPQSVTIMGNSAGACSVHYHLLSPMSRGLFHKAISMDGTAINPWAFSHMPLKIAQKQARFLSCPTEPTSELVQCMRELPAEQICGQILRMFALFIMPSTGYAPVVEKKTQRNPEPFITEDPLKLMQNGNFTKVPWLLGGTNNPGTVYALIIAKLKILLDQVKEKPYEMFCALEMLPQSVNEDHLPYVVKRLEQFYHVNVNANGNIEIGWADLTSDRHFIHGTYKTALLHSLAGHSPIYKYNLAYHGLFSTSLFTTLENHGTSHGDENFFLFRGSKFLWNPDDREISDVMTAMWANFIKHGNPTPAKPLRTNSVGGLLDELVWEPIAELSENYVHLRYLNIGQVERGPPTYLRFNLGPVKLNMADDLFNERMKFWDSLPLRENVPCSVCERVISSSSQVRAGLLVVCIVVLNLMRMSRTE